MEPVGTTPPSSTPSHWPPRGGWPSLLRGTSGFGEKCVDVSRSRVQDIAAESIHGPALLTGHKRMQVVQDIVLDDVSQMPGVSGLTEETDVDPSSFDGGSERLS